MGRVTINEIARRAGVSKGAVSYALNGRPGVSESTRARILDLAAQLGWAPNRTARLLSGSRTDTFGLVLARDPRTLGNEPFYMEFLAGMESVLSPQSYALLLQVVPSLDAELEVYRRWASENRVDAVAVVDIRNRDPRPPVLRSLGLPAVFVGDPSLTDGFTTVWTDDALAMTEAVRQLADLGHRRMARVTGLPDLGHVHIRNQAFLAAAERYGVAGSIVTADFSADAGRQAAGQLLGEPQRPTAILFDNDLMAVSSLAALGQLGLSAPQDVSILAWDDSALCEISYPQLSAMSHDVMSFGAHVGRRLFDVLGGAAPAAHLDSVPQFVQRGSTAPPPGD